jgi:hypothetical protein
MLWQRRPESRLHIAFVRVDTVGHAKVMTEDSPTVHYEFFRFTFRATKKGDTWEIDSQSVKKENGSVTRPDETPVVE